MSSVYEYALTVTEDHLDLLGHVNNVVYLQWAEKVAWLHSQALGIGWSDFQTLDAAMVARTHELNYLAACFAGDQLMLRTWLSDRDGVSMFRQYEFVRQSDQRVVFQGHTRWVCIRLSTGRPMRMPEAFKNAYQV